MTARAHHPQQFVSVRGGAWHVGGPESREMPAKFYARDPLPARTIRHVPPRLHFNEPSTLPPDPVAPSRAPLSAFDKMTRHDPEHGIIKYNNKLAMDRDVNAEAFASEGQGGKRAPRANVGYPAVKAKGWR